MDFLPTQAQGGRYNLFILMDTDGPRTRHNSQRDSAVCRYHKNQCTNKSKHRLSESLPSSILFLLQRYPMYLLCAKYRTIHFREEKLVIST